VRRVPSRLLSVLFIAKEIRFTRKCFAAEVPLRVIKLLQALDGILRARSYKLLKKNAPSVHVGILRVYTYDTYNPIANPLRLYIIENAEFFLLTSLFLVLDVLLRRFASNSYCSFYMCYSDVLHSTPIARFRCATLTFCIQLLLLVLDVLL